MVDSRPGLERRSSDNLLIGCLIASVILSVFPFAGLILSVLVGVVVWLRADLRADWRFRIITIIAIAWNVVMLVTGWTT